MDHTASRMAGFMDSGRQRHTLALLYGRRRIGKSTLLSGLTRQRNGFYWEANQAESRTQLHQLGEALGDFLGTGRVALDDWNDALRHLLRLGTEGPTPVVLDEFGYLLDAEPSLASLIANHLGPATNTEGQGQARLVLCGSAISMMRSLTAGQAPLRGRAGLEEVMHPADHREALRWYPDRCSDELALRLYSVIGGVVGYATDMVDADLPTDMDDFDRWVSQRVLSPAAALHREATTLLAEDPDLSSSLSVFHSILGQIANGSVHAGAIARGLGRSVESLSPALNRLVEAGFVRRHEDPIRQNRPTYALDDPFLQFHYAVLGPHGHRLRDRPPLDVWRATLRARFDSQVRGPVFEEVTRAWVRRYASQDTIGGVPTAVGPSHATVDGQRHELDVAVADDPTPGCQPAQRRLLAIGEAKAGETASRGHLAHLERVRAAVGTRAATAKLLVFAPSFAGDLAEAAARRDDVELVDLARLYRGA